MINQQPDNFFKEKLADYHKPAPRAAWNRIESALEKPKTKFGWWKIAASFLLLTTTGYTLWYYTSSANTESLAQTEKKIESATLEADQHEVGPSEKKQDLTTNDEPSATVNSTEKKSEGKKIRQHKKIIPSVAPTLTPSFEENFQRVEPSSSETDEEQVAPTVREIPKSSSITLTLTVEETNKYLNKYALAEATSKEQKPSTFKKLLKKANDLKSNQDPFGDLREKKNEILALDFKNEKRGQNK